MPQFEHPVPTRDHARPFRLSERRIWPGCIEIEVEGELDLAVSDRLRRALDPAKVDSCHVLLDFAACDFIDSSGLAVLVDAARAFAARNRQLLLYGVHGQVRRILSLTGLTGKTVLNQSFTVALADGGFAHLTLPAPDGRVVDL